MHVHRSILLLLLTTEKVQLAITQQFVLFDNDREGCLRFSSVFFIKMLFEPNITLIVVEFIFNIIKMKSL